MLHPQRKTMDLVPLVCLCLLTWSAGTAADHKPVVVYVEPGSDVILPCSLSTQESLTFEHFEWKKDQKQVFFYDEGTHSNNNPLGPDQQFKGRVSHFKDQLRNGSASIKIRNTQLADSGTYTCVFPRLQPPQTFYIKLVVDGDLRNRYPGVKEPVVVYVEPGSDVVLPCSLSTQQSLTFEFFEWKKDQKQVFLYDSGIHSNSKSTGQDQQFKGRVIYFSDQLKNGSASIMIRNTQLADIGNYTCDFPRLQPPQTFYIKLVFDGDLRNRYPEVKGSAAKPSVRLVKTDDGALLLQCEVRGVSPKPKVELKDSAGNILPAEEPQVTERGGSYDVILQAPLTKTDTFTCVVTQEELNHQISDWTYAGPLNGPILNRWVKDGDLRNRYSEVKGAAAKPSLKQVLTKDGMLLQCEVKGASPKPKVEWKDSAGNILPAEELPAEKGSYDVILQAPVTKTDTFTCVVTQEEIHHQISDWTYAALNEKTSNKLIIGVVIGAVVGIIATLIVVYVKKRCGLSPDNDNSEPNQQRGENNGLLPSPETKSASKDQDNTPV